ncbi:hypothetical protein AWC38_SpisGene563 [Stylophora pistillata]|uniref:Death domain-containing protein n=1 Tax=Stylophora pistillata TaxID=50429 RepID=A0A2B4SZW1_STYPI|nr:hypothetical protein AWC38_SpisGene563 [Stylophora pistillata]
MYTYDRSRSRQSVTTESMVYHSAAIQLQSTNINAKDAELLIAYSCEDAQGNTYTVKPFNSSDKLLNLEETTISKRFLETVVVARQESLKRYISSKLEDLSPLTRNLCQNAKDMEEDFSKNNNTLDPTLMMTENLIHDHRLPELIGPVKWRDLARVLGFNETAIEGIQIEKERCPKECCIAVLARWIHRKGRDATVGKLAKALIKIELKNVADILLGPINDRRTISIEVRGTIKVDDANQEIKDYINTIDLFIGNIPKETEQVVVEDLTSKVDQISENLEKLQKTLSDIKSSLNMPELKEDALTMRGKLDFIGRQSRTLEEVYSEVTRMTSQACTCDEFVRRKFYDFTYYNLKTVHTDLNARIADLKSADTSFTKEENEKLQILLADQEGREKQVEDLEAARTLLFSAFLGSSIPRVDTDAVLSKKSIKGSGRFFTPDDVGHKLPPPG